MTREQQIVAAVRVFAPALRTEADYARCRADIDDALNIIDVEIAKEDVGIAWRSKESRRAVAAFAKALKRAEAAYNALPELVRHGWFQDLDLNPIIAKVEGWSGFSEKAGPPRRKAHKQRAAAREAWRLLWEYGLSQKARRGSHWHRLTAILYGDKQADLFRHLRNPDLFRGHYRFLRLPRPDPGQK